MARKQQSDEYPEEETQRRFEALVKAALNTPPKPVNQRSTTRRRSSKGDAKQRGQSR